MLPLEETWFRRLLLLAVGLGVATGALGLVYLGATGALGNWLFDRGDGTLWSGQWWWIPLTAVGGLLVAGMRRAWQIPDDAPGGVAMIEAASVDHMTAPRWLAVALVSTLAGASLGPSFALILIGGGLGSWIARRWPGNETARQDYTLTGVAGGLGGAFTSPMLGAFLVSELAPTPRDRYVATFIPQLLAAVISFTVFYSVAGRTFLEMYALPPYEFEIVHLLDAAVLGMLSALVMVLMVVIIRYVTRAARAAVVRTNRFVVGAIGGAAIGFAAFALPLTISSGNTQLGTVLDNSEMLGAGLLIGVLLVKMVVVALSLGVGFMGGNVFPLLFVGGTAGAIVHVLVPDVPYALAVSCMLAAVPGSYLRAPVSLTFIAVITIGLGGTTTAPVAVAVVCAYLTAAVIMYVTNQHREGRENPTPA